MQSSAKIKLRKDIHRFQLENDLLLFDELSSRLFHLNRTAALIWKGLEAGFTKREIIDTLAHSTGCSPDQLDVDFEDMLHQWQSLGLRGDSSVKTEKNTSSNNSNPQSFPILDHETIPEILSGGLQITFRLINTHFRLIVPTEKELDLIRPIVSHLLVDCHDGHDVELAILPDDQGYVLLEDGNPLDWCDDISGVAPMVHANSAMISYERTECFFGLHAAAVGYGDKCILMPANSGSGKSTLTAALMGSGFNYFADDLVLLSQPPIRMYQVPIALGLKKGSWEVAQSYHPVLASLPTHVRIDGKKIRYLEPPARSKTRKADERRKVDVIIFPCFDKGCNTSTIEKIGPAEGLCKLAGAGYDIRSQLTTHKVGQMIDWIADIPCYNLRFSQLSDAIDSILSIIK